MVDPKSRCCLILAPPSASRYITRLDLASLAHLARLVPLFAMPRQMSHARQASSWQLKQKFRLCNWLQGSTAWQWRVAKLLRLVELAILNPLDGKTWR